MDGKYMTQESWVGHTFDTYHIQDVIGRGGMATVYVAYDAARDQQVAIKVIYGDFSKNHEAVRRFQREVAIVQKLRHPNILPLYGHGEIDGQLYMVTRFIEGGSLSDYIALHDDVSPRRVAAWLKQLGGALDYAHSQGIVHRDIKPANILMNKVGKLYLADFGVARLEGGTALTMMGDIIPGTAHYVSPEQASGSPNLDFRSDIYSLAVMVYRLCVGAYPFDGSSATSIAVKHVMDAVPRPSAHKPGLPPELDEVIMRGMAKLPSERYDSVGAFVDAFEQAAGGALEEPATPLITPPSGITKPLIPLPPHDEQAEIETLVGFVAPVLPDSPTVEHPASPPPATNKQQWYWVIGGIVLAFIVLFILFLIL